MAEGGHLAKSFARLDARSICVVPLGASQSECGILVYQSPPTLARDRTGARLASVGYNYAGVAITLWGMLSGLETQASVPIMESR